MVKIANGKNTLIVPTSAFNEYYRNAGWEIIAVKKKDSVVKVAENIENVNNINNENKRKNKRN